MQLFKIKYEFQQGGPLYERSYPRPEDIENSIFIIKGAADQGKSTVLQMIALGLHGLDSEDIEDALKERMRRLISDYTDKCEFDYTIASKDGKIKLESQLRNRSPTLFVNEAKKGPDYVRDHFQILFDVPEEPTKKLTSALTSIRNHLSQYQGYLDKYASKTDKALIAIAEYSQKEDTIREQRESLVQRKNELKNLEDRRASVEKQVAELERIRIVHLHEKLIVDFQDLDYRKKELEKKKRELKNAGKGGGSKPYRDAIKNCSDKLSDLRFVASTSGSLSSKLEPKEKDTLKAMIKGINRTNIPSQLTDEKLKNWRFFFEGVLQKLKSNPMTKKRLPEEDLIELLRHLIDILKQYVEVNVEIPGTRNLTANQFLKELETSLKNSTAAISDKLELRKAVESCEDIKGKIDATAIAYSLIPKSESDEGEFDQVEESLKKIEQQLTKIAKDSIILEEKYDKIPQKEREQLVLVAQPNESDYQSKKEEITALGNKIENLKRNIQSIDANISAYKAKQKPPGYDNLEELKRKKNQAQDLFRSIGLWLDDIKDLERIWETGGTTENMLVAKSSGGRPDEKASRLYQALGDYFGSILKVVHFENKEWKLRTIDIIDRCYVVDSREPIHFIDIGTGHTTLNALLAKIKQDYGGKKKILLFDEIGVMHPNVMNVLLKEIKNRVLSGDVLFAILSMVDPNVSGVLMEPIKCD